VVLTTRTKLAFVHHGSASWHSHHSNTSVLASHSMAEAYTLAALVLPPVIHFKDKIIIKIPVGI